MELMSRFLWGHSEHWTRRLPEVKSLMFQYIFGANIFFKSVVGAYKYNLQPNIWSNSFVLIHLIPLIIDLVMNFCLSLCWLSLRTGTICIFFGKVWSCFAIELSFEISSIAIFFGDFSSSPLVTNVTESFLSVFSSPPFLSTWDPVLDFEGDRVPSSEPSNTIGEFGTGSVSYTHLPLPTSYSV